MGQTAIVSPQIIDSTQIGRDLITAADQAAAQAIIGVTGVDTSADYTWTGDNTFEGILAADYIEWTNVNGIHNQPNINGYHFFAFAGSNVFRASALDFIPMSNNTKNLGRSDLRWSDVYSVDGDFSGTVTTDSIDYASSLIISNNGTERLEVAPSRIRPSVNFFPKNDNFVVCGQEGSRWKSVASVDGSFSGNLVSEAGGSYKLYNLGTEGDADTEYAEMLWDSNIFKVDSKSTGAGTDRAIRLGAGTSYININANNSYQFYRAGSQRIAINSQNITFYKAILPSGTLNAGSTSARWNLFANTIDASSTVTLSGLPTSDPAVAGQLWNDSGTVKISAG